MNHDLYVITLNGSIYKKKIYFSLEEAKKFKKLLPKHIREVVNIHLFKSTGIVEHANDTEYSESICVQGSINGRFLERFF